MLLSMPEIPTSTLKQVDIAEDDGLLERYGVRIPVLKAAGSSEDLGWPFDPEQVRHYLARLAADSPP